MGTNLAKTLRNIPPHIKKSYICIVSCIEVLKLWKKETNIIEHKSQWRDEWLQWICGFANNQGGVINIGLNDTLEHQNVTLESTENKADAVLERQNVTLNVTLDDTLKDSHEVLEVTDNKGDNTLEPQNDVLNDVLEGAIEHQTYHLIKKDRKITIVEISKELRVGKATIERCIKTLKDKGFLDRTKNNRYGEWIIKK